MLAGLFSFLGLVGLPFAGPASVQAQADSSRSDQPARPSSSPSNGATAAVGELFQQHCAKCHGKDGTGTPGRNSLPDIPDFTAASWQAQRSDAELLAAILEGKGDDMPAFARKIKEEQARDLVPHIRAFAPTKGKSKKEKQEKPDSSGFEDRFSRLQKEMEQLRRQSQELSQSPRPKPSKSSESSPNKAEHATVPKAAETSSLAELFQKHCVKCHGADGTGGQARDRLPEIPDFTDSAWQARRTDKQIQSSILEGKGKEMPPTRGKVNDKQAGDLVAYVRSFVPTGTRAEQEETPPSTFQPQAHELNGSAPAEFKEGEPARKFLTKLIFWLGKFHPAAVHFPIGLLTAAAAAELLQWTTGKPGFNTVTRFCLWAGTIAAVVAGLLGWFVGSSRWADASWILITHSWLGTSTVAFGGAALVLSEMSRRADHSAIRTWFRFVLLFVAVLVLVTGFFGGAVVHGLKHYAWPLMSGE
jgi:mono/diheme cytochrome c family protein/uncharacterized membrane protein